MLWQRRAVAAAASSLPPRASRLFSSSVASKSELARRSQHLLDAVRIVHAYSTSRYDESVDISVVLNVDYKRSDERVRGNVLLPHGVGKTTRVCVFAQGQLADEARAP